MGVRFEWDRNKAAANLTWHGVSFDEASTVFYDPLAKIFDRANKKRAKGLRRKCLLNLFNPNPTRCCRNMISITARRVLTALRIESARIVLW